MIDLLAARVQPQGLSVFPVGGVSDFGKVFGDVKKVQQLTLGMLRQESPVILAPSAMPRYRASGSVF